MGAQKCRIPGKLLGFRKLFILPFSHIVSIYLWNPMGTDPGG